MNRLTPMNELQAVAEAARAAIQTMSVAATGRTEYVGPRISGTIMKQPTCDWTIKDKYAELRKFKLEVKNILQNFNMSQAKRASIMKNWLGRQGLQH